jgi:hypothetical protein
MVGRIVHLSDKQWEQIRDILPPVTGSRARSNRECVDAILTAATSTLPNKWASLKGTTLCPAATAKDRLAMWWEDGIPDRLADTLLLQDDSLRDVDWAWVRNGGRNLPGPRY